MLNGDTLQADAIVAAADYHHVENDLLQTDERGYSSGFWKRQVMAPSALMFYLGFDRRLPHLQHHTLFFDEPLDQHSEDIFDRPRWPRAPLFYVSCTSKTDPSTAPAGCENLTVLIPVAAGLQDDTGTREHYFNVVMDRLGARIGFDPRPHVILKRSYCINDLQQEHHSYRGNAYGLANTLRQTGPLRPRIRSNKVKGLYFAGQLTVPGPGVPPALISGQIAADLLDQDLALRA
jgi:phytoene desaturase